MKKSEKNMIFQEAALMSDEKLKEAYYDSVDACLGSQAEIMEDRGWDPVDIKERRQYEKFLSEKSDLLGCGGDMRGIITKKKTEERLHSCDLFSFSLYLTYNVIAL